MIDSEMSFPEGEISSNSHVYKGKYLQLKCSVSTMPEKMGVWKSRNPESRIGKGIGTGTGSGTGIGTGMGRESYIKTEATYIYLKLSYSGFNSYSDYIRKVREKME